MASNETHDGDDLPQLISLTTVLSLAAVTAILSAAYGLSRTLLPKTTTTKFRLLFIWHTFDALIHFILEGSFLYNCFFTWAPFPSYEELPTVDYFPVPMTPYGTSFLGQSGRLYGSFYGDNPMALLWQEYARADRRWGGSDLTIISLELLTVFVMGPMAVYACYLMTKEDYPKAWFIMTIVATGELYGGFMTFAPEWLTGNPNLDASNWMYLWLYLVFFNAGLWVVIPIWVLYEAYVEIQDAFIRSGRIPRSNKSVSIAKSKQT